MEQIQKLITRVINGDTQAFEEIYQATYRQVYYTAFSFLKNEQNTLDVMQDTYITALTHLQQLENPERIVAWLNQIAVNKCKDFLMKKIPEPIEENSIDTELLEENDNFLPESYVLNAEKRKIILTIMQEELSAVQYQTIILYYFDGMSVPEIAACMECPEGTVKYRLSTARGKIRNGVQDYEDTSGIKLYSSGSVALLTAIFIAESQSLNIPNVISNIFAGAAGIAGTAAGVAGTVAASGSGMAGAAGSAAASSVSMAATKAAGVAGKAGIKAMEEEDYKEAVTQFTQAASTAEAKGKKEDAAEAYRGLGMAYYELKEYDKVLESMQKALDDGVQRTAELYNIMGVSAMKQEDYESALKYFDEGISYAQSKDAVNASKSKKEVDYSELIQEMRYNQIVCYEKQENWEEAKNAANEYIADYPNDENIEKEVEFLETR